MYTVQVWMVETDIRSQSLHWPIRLRMQYKLCVLMHLVRVGRSSAYLADMMTATADLPDRERLRSANSFRYETPKLKLKFGERGFSYAGPKAWNSLPANLQELTNTDTFKQQLKIYSPRCKFRFSSNENLIEVVILIH